MFKQLGYTLIELIIVIAIIMIVAAVSLPAYKQFTIPQALNNSVLQLKSDLRIVHNNAVNGVKNSAGNRVYWTFRVVGGQSYYEVSGCAKSELFSDCKNTSHDYEQKQMGKTFAVYPCNLPCSDTTSITGITLYFKPVDGTIQMYNNVDSILPDATGNMPQSYTAISFLVKSLEDTTKTGIVTINTEGTITSK